MCRLACRCPRRMRPFWPIRRPPLHRVWMSPHRTRLRVDPAPRLDRRAIRLAPHAQGVWKGRGRAG
jgi:hypothetical protein